MNICHSWVSFQDWDLHDLCDDDVPGGKNYREGQTIEDLKITAEEYAYDGFTVSSEWPQNVYFKNCEVEDNSSLINALSYRPGREFYLHMAHPCTETNEIDEFDNFAQWCWVGDYFKCLRSFRENPDYGSYYVKNFA